MIRESLSLRVLVISFLLLALPLLIDSLLFFHSSYASSVDGKQQELARAANVTSIALVEVQPYKNEFLKELNFFLGLSEKMKDDPKSLNEEFKKITAFEPNLKIYLLKPNLSEKNPVVASSETEPLPLKDHSFRHIEGVPDGEIATFIHFIFSPQKNHYVPVLFKAMAIESKETPKSVLGYLMIAADIENYVDDILYHALNWHPGMQFALVDQGIIFAATDRNLIGQILDQSAVLTSQGSSDQVRLGNVKLAKKPLQVIQDKNSPFFEFIFNNNVELAYVSSLPESYASVLTYFPKNLLFSEALTHFLFLYILLGALILGGGAVAYWFTNLISRPLQQLSSLMEKVRTGNFRYRFQEERYGFEINALGNIFNHTLDTLLENIEKAENLRISKETYAKELEIGLSVQEKLLPATLPNIEGIELAAQYVTAAEAGGDFYDVILKEGKLFLTIADVAGKGISSPLYSLGLRSQLRSFVTLYDDVGKILTSANALFCKDTGETGMYATVLMGNFDLKSKILTYFSCGHLPGIVRKINGQIVRLSHTGMAMGLLESQEFHSEKIQLESEDILIFYTNGLTQATNEKNQFFGTNRLINCLQHRKWFTASEIASGFVEELKQFRGNQPLEGEVALIVMKVL